MAPSPDSKGNGKDKDNSPPAPPPSSKSPSPPSSPPTQSPSTPDSSAPPPSNPSPPPAKKSPPPPKSPPPSPPPSSPPPPSEEASSSPSEKSSPSSSSTTSKGSPPTASPPPKEDSPTPSPPPSSRSSSSPSKSPPPSDSSPESEDSSSSSSSSSSPSSSSSSSSSSLSSSSPPSPPSPSPSPSNSSSSSFSPPPINSSSSSPPSPASIPSPPVDSPAASGPTLKSEKDSPNRQTNFSLDSASFVHPPSHPQEQATRLGIAFGIVAAVLIVGFILAILFVHKRRKKHNRYNTMYMVPSAFASSPDTGSSFTKPSPNVGGDFIHSSPDTAGIGNSKTWFSYEELATATDGFDSKNVIGAGGFGCVYKGFLQEGKEVAIKKLKDKSGQGDREFRAEVEIISRVHHRHLVTLVGYCIVDHQRLLVYEFVPNNTLYHHLHDPNKTPMIWALRVRVACGSARGIAYLHEDCNPRIIHRDIKSANILLANNFEAKVSDFGLAKLAQELESNTHVSTRVMGTFGYMAPEYATSGKLTEKSDVFSFGVVLLELITGRKPVDDSRPLGDESLVEWARPLMTEALESQNFDQLADPRMEGNYDRGEMFRMIEAAAACVRHSASKRPRMSQVARALDTMGDLSNGVKPGESEIMDSREQSVQIRMFQRMTFESQEYSSENYNSQSSWASRDTTASASTQGGRWSGET